MKLLHKTIRNYLISTVTIMLLMGVALFFMLQKEVSLEMDEQLEWQAELVTEQIEAGKPVHFPLISINKTDKALHEKKLSGDTLIFDKLQQQNEDYRYMTIIKAIHGTNYQITVMTTHIGWDKYYKTIFCIFTIMTVMLIVAGVLITYILNKRLWKPFFLNLENLKAFSVSSSRPLQLHNSNVIEFQELQNSLKDLTDRSRQEYIALREFTENASHEIQTPLAIIQSKLDRLSQMEITEEMSMNIVQAKSGVERLSKTNKALLMLAKLDNNAYKERQTQEVCAILQEQLDLLSDLFANKNISITKEIQQTNVFSNKYLCETLISNLISNAFRYTPQNGAVNIRLINNSLFISNTGHSLEFENERIFERFKKGSKSHNSTGLGLSIVKQICLHNNWSVNYTYLNMSHTFVVNFK